MGIKELKIELIKETAAFYKSDTRSIQVGSLQACVYDDGNDHRCAVGRILTEAALLWVKHKGMNAECGVDTLMIEAREVGGILLEKWMPLQDEIPFLMRLQKLHDKKLNWDEKGLSPEGTRYVEKMIRDVNEQIL